MTPDSPEASRPLRRDDLESLFHEAEKPASEFRIGGEAEKIALHADTLGPVPWEGPRGVAALLARLAAAGGYEQDREGEGAPVIALRRGDASITLEPGGQVELSGAPHSDLHAVAAEMTAHLEELRAPSRELGLVWLGLGFHPLARLDQLPWVPKRRYSVMKRYLPERGSRALDMMQRTATVQANFDFSSEEDAMQKFVVLARLGPIVQAMTANAPFLEGRVASRRSERGDVWLHMDPARSGVTPVAWLDRPTYRDYAEWALDAGMFLFRRGGEYVHNTGQTFRDFLANGHEGHRATFADWALHVNTLFPEARLKRTLEFRSCDMLPAELTAAVPALATGLIYDPVALSEASELAAGIRREELEAARPDLVTRGLGATLGGAPVRALAERILDVALRGLDRRALRDAAGRTERAHLEPLAALVGRGLTPADVAVSGLAPGEVVAPAEILRRARLAPGPEGLGE